LGEEKRDPLTGVKCKGRLQLHVCESVVFVSWGKVHPRAGVIVLQVGESTTNLSGSSLNSLTRSAILVFPVPLSMCAVGFFSLSASIDGRGTGSPSGPADRRSHMACISIKLANFPDGEYVRQQLDNTPNIFFEAGDKGGPGNVFLYTQVAPSVFLFQPHLNQVTSEISKPMMWSTTFLIRFENLTLTEPIVPGFVILW
jgi:hypothetical protein